MFQGDVLGGSAAAGPALSAVPDASGGLAVPFLVGSAPARLLLRG
jgi:hypothetical protein